MKKLGVLIALSLLAQTSVALSSEPVMENRLQCEVEERDGNKSETWRIDEAAPEGRGVMILTYSKSRVAVTVYGHPGVNGSDAETFIRVEGLEVYNSNAKHFTLIHPLGRKRMMIFECEIKTVAKNLNS
ncbi:MAG TPA: hypothetical protein VM598_14735 [Bdellovibrionota bacterium]|nr:hypothetical protein [Bdellovibrionota bacterium]